VRDLEGVWQQQQQQRTMSDTESETFETLEEELEYWKLKYTNKSLELVELEEQFDEYRQYTKDVEVHRSLARYRAAWSNS